jgi:hypothetical protein
MEAMAQDPLDSDHQIEEQERRRDDQDEAGRDHCFPQSSCQFCQEYGNARNYLAPPGALAGPGFMASLRGAAMIGNSAGVMVLPAVLILTQAEKFRPLIPARLLTR